MALRAGGHRPFWHGRSFDGWWLEHPGSGSRLARAGADHSGCCRDHSSAIAQMPNISAPVRLISGDQDDIVDWQTNTQAMYNVGRPPRQLLLIQGGCHCGFLDSNIPFCDSGSLPRADNWRSRAARWGQGSPGSVVSYSVTVTNLDTQPTDYALMARTTPRLRLPRPGQPDLSRDGHQC